MDYFKVESVYNDIDFSMKVTRQVFESTCADMKVRFVQPIYDALDNANLTLVRVLLMQRRNMTLRRESIGGHKFGHINGWSYTYTDGQGCANSNRESMFAKCFCMRSADDRVLSGKNSQ